MKKKKKLIINTAILTIKITLNNIFITLSEENGNVLIYKSTGSLGYKGLKKKTSFVVAETLSLLFDELEKKPYQIKLFILNIRCFWLDWAIDTIWKVLKKKRIKNIFYINYSFLKAHNGVRKKKKRRL